MRRFSRWVRPALAFGVLFATLVPAVGCGWMAEEIAEQHHISKRAREYEFGGNVDATWEEARTALAESGFRLEGDPRVDETVECPGPESRTHKERAHLRITKTGWFSHKLEIEILEERLEDGKWTTSRGRQATSIEWKVIKRRDPSYAAEVEAEADKKGKKGREIVKDIDDLLSD